MDYSKMVPGTKVVAFLKGPHCSSAVNGRVLDRDGDRVRVSLSGGLHSFITFFHPDEYEDGGSYIVPASEVYA